MNKSRLQSAVDRARQEIRGRPIRVLVLARLPVPAFLYMGELAIRKDFADQLDQEEVEFGARWLCHWANALLLPTLLSLVNYFLFSLLMLAIIVTQRHYWVNRTALLMALVAFCVVTTAAAIFGLIRTTVWACVKAFGEAVKTGSDEAAAKAILQKLQCLESAFGRRTVIERCKAELEKRSSG